MPYNPKTQSTIIVSKRHHSLLKAIAKKQRRTMQMALEILIESEAEKAGVVIGGNHE